MFEVTTQLNDGENNQPPTVVINEPGIAWVNQNYSLGAQVSDDHTPVNQLEILWSQQLGPADVVFSNVNSINSQVSFSAAGDYTLRLSASDNVLSGFEDVLIKVKDSSYADLDFLRFNVGGPTIKDPSGDWLSDADAVSYVNTGIVFNIPTAVDLINLDSLVPEAIFSTGRWDAGSAPEMKWSIPVTPGDYRVKFYFAEVWSGAFGNGKRVFSVDVEGSHSGSIDIFALSDKNTAMVYSSTVTADNTLDIDFTHITENPSIQGIEIIGLSEETETNKPPVITLLNSATVSIDSSLILDAAVSDDGKPANTLSLQWSKVSGPGSVSFSTTSDAKSTAIFSSVGNYILRLAADDGEHSVFEDIQITVTDLTDPTSASAIRINVGGATIKDPAGDWLSDADAASYVNTGIVFNIPKNVDLSNISPLVPESIFDTGRWDAGSVPEMKWSIPVTPGDYRVNLYFAEVWSGAFGNGKRVFSVDVEGSQSGSIDIFSLSGKNTAMVYSSTVTADNTLDIDFTHITQNPSLQGIEIIGPGYENETNLAPVITLLNTATVSIDSSLILDAAVSDDGKPANTLNLQWSKISGPGSVSFSTTSDAKSTAIFSSVGSYILRLTADDGELSVFDDIQITVTDITNPTNAGVIRINAGGPTLIAADGNWLADANFKQFVNTGYLHSVVTGIDTSLIDSAIPEALFQTSRWDAATAPEMTWSIPVKAGNYQVRLYFAEIWNGAYDIGKRVFSVDIEGKRINDVDVFSLSGQDTAVMRSVNVMADSSLDIEFIHSIENPSIKGIEIVSLSTDGGAPPPTDN